MKGTPTKILICLLLFFSLPIALELTAQDKMPEDVDDVIENIRVAIRVGNSKELSNYLHDPVELNLEEKRESYSRNQAEFVLRDFFTKYKVVEFSYVHQGSSREGLKYVIGKYEHSEGSFQVYMLLKKDENSSEMRVSMANFSEDS
ncbi:MAG: DUF4783 domain-containing protein [Bacteroidota bacterium]